MAITKNMKMADVIHLNYLSTTVINRFGIKLGFGDQTIEEVCKKNRINVNFFLEIINAFHYPDYFPCEQLKGFSVKLIVDYLRESHRFYIENKIPHIENQIDNLLINCQGQNENLILLKNFFKEYSNEFKIHIETEDKKVYPYVLMIEKAFLSTEITPEQYEQIKDYSIDFYADEHSDIEEKLFDMKNIIIKYLTPPLDDNTYNNVLFELFKLEKDLNDHSIIEEKVLVPKIKNMEKRLKQSVLKNGQTFINR